MTVNFDKFCNKVINEYTTMKNKRRSSSRYWKPDRMPDLNVRAVQPNNGRSASQRVKVDKHQQYIGDPYDPKGVRHQNKSEKDNARAGIAKGLGNHVKIGGVNPREAGAKVNSKQGNMEVKYTLPNGLSKVGSTGKTEYKTTELNFKDSLDKKFGGK